MFLTCKQTLPHMGSARKRSDRHSILPGMMNTPMVHPAEVIAAYGGSAEERSCSHVEELTDDSAVKSLCFVSFEHILPFRESFCELVVMNTGKNDPHLTSKIVTSYLGHIAGCK